MKTQFLIIEKCCCCCSKISFHSEQLLISESEKEKLAAENNRVLLKMDELREQNRKMALQMAEWKEKTLKKLLKESEDSFNRCIDKKDYNEAGKHFSKKNIMTTNYLPMVVNYVLNLKTIYLFF